MTLPVPFAFTADPPKIAKYRVEPSDWANPEEGPRRSAVHATPATRLQYLPFIINLAFPRPKMAAP
jgi:hypothetical protein